MTKIDSFCVLLIFLVGGPFFMVSTILEAMLNMFMPEGWNDNDDDSNGV